MWRHIFQFGRTLFNAHPVGAVLFSHGNVQLAIYDAIFDLKVNVNNRPSLMPRKVLSQLEVNAVLPSATGMMVHHCLVNDKVALGLPYRRNVLTTDNFSDVQLDVIESVLMSSVLASAFNRAWSKPIWNSDCRRSSTRRCGADKAKPSLFNCQMMRHTRGYV